MTENFRWELRAMYKILIVDDEKIERNGIRMLLNSLGYSFEIAEANNGQTAYDLMSGNEFDIVLTDIKMPFMNGIELIKKCRDNGSEQKFIIFSGCNEFGYAKQAVKMDVSDYILKPVDPSEFEDTINKVIGEIEESRVHKELKIKSIEFMHEHMLYLATTGASMSEIKEHNKDLLPTDFLDKFKRMMLIEFNCDFFGRKGMDFKEYLEKTEPRTDAYLNLNPQQSVLYFNDDNLPFKDIADNICNDVAITYNTKCFIAISGKIEGYEGITKGMEEMEALMENKFYDRNSNVFYKGMNCENDEAVQTDDDTVIKQMKQDVKMKDAASLREHFAIFCEKYGGKRVFSQVYVKFLFSNLLKTFYESLPATDEKELNEEIELLYKSEDFDTVRGIVDKNIDRLAGSFDKNPSMVHREIEIVKKYIYEHFGEDISVESLSKMVYMAPSYLSSVFKKETGVNLSRFIKTYRMEQAKDMLENSMAKIVDISETCGYSNVSYFCSSFREYFGISPQKFRKNGE